MTKEDKQIIDRAVKETWRIGDRTRLKHLLEKNLKLYRENVELENENAELKEKREQDCDSSWYEGFNCSEKERLDQLTIAKDLIHQFLIQNPISDWLPKKAEQFLKGFEK